MNSEKLTIDISIASLIKVSLFVFLAWLVFELRGVIGVLLASIVIASSVEPAARWLSAYRVPRVLAVILVYLAAFTIFGLIFYLVLPPLVSEMGGFLTDLPDNIETFEPKNILSFLPELPKSFNNVLRDAILNFRDYSFESTSGLLAGIAREEKSGFGSKASCSWAYWLGSSFFWALPYSALNMPSCLRSFPEFWRLSQYLAR